MLTILVGLPGSGKGHLSRELAKGLPGARIYEDFLGAKTALDDAHGLFALLADVEARRPVFADDIFLCRPERRRMFLKLLEPFLGPDYPVRWIYFENDPVPCKRNVKRRSAREPHLGSRNKSAEENVDVLPADYVIPDDVTPRPVYKGD